MLEVVEGEMLDVVEEVPAAPLAAEPIETPSWRSAPPEVRKAHAPGRTPPQPPAPQRESPAQPPAPSWRDAPPPVRKSDAPDANATVRVRRPSPADTVVPIPKAPEPPRRRSASETLSDVGGQPLELPPGVWDAPPVRRGETVQITPEYSSDYQAAAPRVSRRRAWLVMTLVVAVVGSVLGAAIYLVSVAKKENEDQLFADAQKALEEGKLSSAAEQFRHLREQFPDGDQAATYRFLEDWAHLAGDLQGPQADPAVLEELEKFLDAHKGEPVLKAHGHDIGKALVVFAENFGQRNANPTSEAPLESIARLDASRTKLYESAGKEALEPGEGTRINQTMRSVRVAVERWQRRSAILANLRARPATADGIRDARRLLQDHAGEFPDLSGSPEVAEIFDKLYKGHLESIVYVPGGGPERPAAAPEILQPSVVFDPLLAGTPGSSRADDPTVLAVARGLLYGLSQRTGAIKWARRVGIDTTRLPVVVPADVGRRERILALSSDSATLTALDADGTRLWDYHLQSPCLGRPLVVEGRAFLPTLDGVVHEIELARGQLVGRYRLGQRLTVGGASEAGSGRLYLPGDDSCVYVLDTTQRRCTLVLYTNHPSGSLRSEPLLIPPVVLGGVEIEIGYLVLNQAEGLDAIRLRVFDLPLKGRDQGPRPLNPEPRLAGWTWFRPSLDAEKVVALSDRGVLGLFGIRQPKNIDQPLFPLVGSGGLSLDAILPPTPHRGRAQVVQMQGDDFWVLANGGLQRLALAWDAQTGPKLVKSWPKSLSLGSPLHEAQVVEKVGGDSSILFLVTQPARQAACVATAVDDVEGHVLWQRQLGVVCRGEPLWLTPGGGGGPLLVCMDQAGSLFALNPERFPPTERAPWQGGGQSVAGALDENPQMAPMLLPGPDGKSVYQLACPGDGGKLLIRRVEWSGEDRRLACKEREIALPAALAGPPAVVDGMLVLPLASGHLVRLPIPLPDEPTPDSGPDWRSRVAPPGAAGYVLSLGGDLMLTTDGGRGLTCWRWPRGNTFTPLGTSRQKPTSLDLTDRVGALPVLLPGPADGPQRVCVADSAGEVSLLAMRGDGLLEVKRTWPLHGALTAGPFLRTMPGGETRIGCVVEGRRLVWLDPNRDKPAWEYQTTGGAVAGQPQLIEGLVVVADGSGNVKALDPGDGKEKAPGYHLAGSVVPAASPVAFGPRRLFVPLSDGTALLLEMHKVLPGGNRGDAPPELLPEK
jgi:outer membrane protein assembly factor BamB